MTLALQDWAKEVPTSNRMLTLAGLGAALVFAAVFGTWASLAPLSGAAVAEGFVAAAGLNQNVQHLEGGIVKEILVREGDTVRAGQPVAVLDSTAMRVQHDRIQYAILSGMARIARLEAEWGGLDAIEFPEETISLAEEIGGLDLFEEQRREFSARLEGHTQELSILNEQIHNLTGQIDGLSAQKQAIERQIELVQEELERQQTLLEGGLAGRSEYAALLRSQANFQGQLGQVTSDILSTRSRINESQEQIARLRTQRIETALTELGGVRDQVSDAQDQLRAAEDVLTRATLRAPIDGVVVSMAVNSVGSVVRPGEVVLVLLPINNELIIEARLRPQDIDLVSIGQSAKLRFVALNTRTTPSVDAVVTYVSADRLVDTNSGLAFYVARLTIDGDLPPEIDASQIYPGMPVETLILTQDRTFLEYLTKPIFDSFNRAFREE